MTSKEYIQQRIKIRSTTLSEVSELMGYSHPSGLHNILKNPKRLTIEQVIKLAEILKLKPHSLAIRITNS
jgi:antitoxin component HigA of HigAB toxin-antitoxin module